MKEKTVSLDHGSGGKASHTLIEQLFRSAFDNAILNPLEDSAVFEASGARFAFSTDSYVVDPIFFAGGNIGELAVNGTVNDLAMRGARPLFISAAMIIEEGLAMADLETIVSSMKKAADLAGVQIVTGDTKVVQKGKADKIFINTAGLGIVKTEHNISGTAARPGDAILLSGTMADHGVTILCSQQGLKISGGFASDTTPLNHMVAKLLEAVEANLHVLRDPTRGGVATTLNEIAGSSGVGIVLEEDRLPVRNDVRGACELLGLDPLYLANEGKLLAFVAPEAVDQALAALKSCPKGGEACRVGTAVADHPGKVFLKTSLGSLRLVDMLHGHPLPRIC
jgi:hydrogenase expression/formation protein HypE